MQRLGCKINEPTVIISNNSAQLLCAVHRGIIMKNSRESRTAAKEIFLVAAIGRQ